MRAKELKQISLERARDKHLERIEGIVGGMDFDTCLEVYYNIPAGHLLMDYIMDRMEELDVERYHRFLDGEE